MRFRPMIFRYCHTLYLSICNLHANLRHFVYLNYVTKDL